VLRIFWNFFKQLAALAGEVFVFIFAIAGLCLMLKYLGKAMILVLPLLVLFAGLGLLSYAKMRKRAKDRHDAKQRELRR
jgi:hypothetical protein